MCWPLKHSSADVFQYCVSIPNLNVGPVRTPGPRGLINKNAMMHLVSTTQGIHDGHGETELH